MVLFTASGTCKSPMSLSKIVHVGFTHEVSLNVPKTSLFMTLHHVKIDENLRRTCVREKTIAAPSTNIFTGDWAINYDF